MNNHKFPYEWKLKDGYPKANGLNVFGTFICGGGSTMGYKLAGFNHLGGVELDPKLADVYKTNHNPKYLYVEDIRAFNERNDLPKELYNLDVLDGSPPCSNFSILGNREKDWNKKKKFREGQSKQVLDDLVFVYCDTIIKLQPKVFILENVKGIIQGNAKNYSKKIVKKMTDAGYNVQVFLLNAASMGVPQRRERVFFIGYKKPLNYKKLQLRFNQKSIVFNRIIERDKNNDLTEVQQKIWNAKIPSDKTSGDVIMRIEKRLSGFSNPIVNSNTVCPTVNAQGGSFLLYDLPRHINRNELCKVGSYPSDYNFKEMRKRYIIGMSVPPIMIAQIATEIKKQWLS